MTATSTSRRLSHRRRSIIPPGGFEDRFTPGLYQPKLRLAIG
jgi:hypothetical protein